MTAGRILIIDNNARDARRLIEILAAGHFQAEVASNEAAALACAERRWCDVSILGGMSPFPLLQRLKSRLPVLLVTARGHEEEGIRGLELGAEDYVSKPFHPRELLARLRAILRRSADRRPDSNAVALGALAIDSGTMSATVDGVAVRLTAAEFLVLEALARSAGRVQSRQTLTYQALGRRLERFDRSIDTHISNIRRKLCLNPARGVEIKSWRGHGYVLMIPPARFQ